MLLGRLRHQAVKLIDRQCRGIASLRSEKERVILMPQLAAISPASPQIDFPENIRLIIWDLDETFWRGTLTEGGVEFIDDHSNLVIELARRGIMSSICSKNDFEAVKSILVERGLWQYFVFASIDWSPKAPRIKEQIEEIGLRPASVLFIDDNPQNLQQVLSHVPGINIADPSVIPFIADHSQFQGRPDLDLTRLAQYKNNEVKFVERLAFSGDNIEFLRGSDIRVYFEYDVESHIDRVIELINRTNQLNFTKEKLPENPEEARAVLLPFLRHTGTTAGLIRVVDKFGDYGFVGFYAMVAGIQYTLKHFCFSCRTLNMYIEHFVYDHIGRPVLNVVGDVLSDVQSATGIVDWIKALPISHLEASSAPDVRMIDSIYARGGCDLTATLHYFSLNCKNIVGEFNTLKNWQPLRIDHSAFLLNSIRPLSAAEMGAAIELGYDADDFKTAFPKGDHDFPEVCLLSFWADADIPFYRHRQTGLELPYFVIGAGKEDLSRDEAAVDRLGTNDIQRARLKTLRESWDYVYGLTHYEMVSRYRSILSQIPERTRVFMTLANDRQPPFFIDPARWPRDENHLAYNRALRETAAYFSNVSLIDFGAYVHKEDDLLDINHLRRELYYKVYQEMIGHLA